MLHLQNLHKHLKAQMCYEGNTVQLCGLENVMKKMYGLNPLESDESKIQMCHNIMAIYKG